MADQDVEIKVGATVDQLDRDIENAKKKIESINESAEKVTEGAKMIAEAFGIAFTLDKIIEFTKAMGELGEATERTMAILGISSKEVGQLSYVGQATGISIEEMSAAINIFARNLQTARSGTGPTAEALKAMGLGARDLAAIPLPDAIGKISDKFTQWRDGLNKTVLAQDLFGRAGARLIPTLDKGSTAIKEMSDRATDLAGTLSGEMVEHLSVMNTSFTNMKTAVTGLGATIMSSLAPAITTMSNAIAEFVGDVAVAINTGTFWERVLLNLKYMWDELVRSVITFAKAAEAAITLDFSGVPAAISKGLDEARAADEKYLSDLGKMMLKQKMLWQQMLVPEEGSQKPKAPETVSKDAISAQAKQIDEQIKLQEYFLDQSKSAYESDVKTFAMTEQQKDAILKVEVVERYGYIQELLQKELSLYSRGTSDYQNVLNRMTEMKSKQLKEIQTLEQKAHEESVKEWEGVGSSITGAFNSQLRGLLAGTTTWAQAMKSITGDLVIKMIEELEKLALVQPFAKMMASAIPPPTALFEGFINIIKSLFGPLTAGFTAFFAPTSGPAAPALGAAAAASEVAAATALVGSFEFGTDYVPRTGLALVHEGEKITPANQNGGGGSIAFNISALDSASMAAWLRNGGAAQIAKHVAGAMTANPTLRPSY